MHHERELDPTRPYSVTIDEITTQYHYGMRRIRARFPKLDLLDPRSQLDD